MANRSNEANRTPKEEDVAASSSVKLLDSFFAEIYQNRAGILCNALNETKTMRVFDQNCGLTEGSKRLRIVSDKDVVEVNIYVEDKKAKPELELEQDEPKAKLEKLSKEEQAKILKELQELEEDLDGLD